MDFNACKQWADEYRIDLSQSLPFAQLESHWAGMQMG